MKLRGSILAAIVIALSIAGAARAAETLTYAAAMKRAIEIDERLRISDHERGRIEAESRENALRVRPSLGLSTSVITNNSALDVQIGGPGAPPRTLQEAVQGDARLEARWDFYQPSHGREQQAYGEEIEAARADRGTVEAAVRYETAGAYLDALVAAARARVAEADLQRARAQATLARERLDAGEGSRLGLRQLDLAVSALESAKEATAVSEDLAGERLRHLLDLDAPPVLPDFDAAGLPGRPGTFDADALVALALGSRTEIAASRRRVEAAKARVVASAAGRRPDAGFAGSVDASTVEGFDGKKVDTRLEVGMRWTFFDSGLRAAGTERELESQRVVELEAAAIARKIETEVRQGIAALRVALLEEDRTTALSDQAAAALEQTEALYVAGSATEMDLSERRGELASASAKLEGARVERVRAFVTLRFAVGSPLPEAS
jgi:outer membrane protein